jgi:unsaturated chondroitin disaccharide hydrolase
MSLPLLVWAGETSGQPAMVELARRVVTTIARQHVRPDGSTYQVVDFDLDTGRAVRYGTHQGYSDESCWSRGQAWAVDGFSRLYLMTGEARWLATAEYLADFFLENLPADGLPYWDFRLPDPTSEPRDSSAAAIAASGLLTLALASDQSARYCAGALRLLGILASTCLTRGVAGQQGILLHGTDNRPRSSAVDESTIYGDHYFVEALTKLLRPDRRRLLGAVGQTPFQS